nr:hypothetical protein [Crucivirus sp.]
MRPILTPLILEASLEEPLQQALTHRAQHLKMLQTLKGATITRYLQDMAPHLPSSDEVESIQFLKAWLDDVYNLLICESMEQLKLMEALHKVQLQVLELEKKENTKENK